MITIDRREVAWMLGCAPLGDLAAQADQGDASSLPARLSLRLIANGKALGFSWAQRAFAESEVARWAPIEAEERAVMV